MRYQYNKKGRMRYQYIKKDGGLKDKNIIKDLKTATTLYEYGMIEEAYDILENIVYELRTKFAMDEVTK